MDNTENKGGTIQDLRKGIESINGILKRVGTIVSSRNNLFYTPRYIYRGISKYFPSPGESEKDDYSEEEVEKGYIRSAHAVRMELTSREYNLEQAYTRTNYISGLQEMVENARKHYPEKYSEDFTDLDILADIQHNGGATCLVDFSKNFFTSLWFACSDHPKSDGYIYCYDVMKDMIENDALTNIRSGEEKLSIYDLLYNTHKETNISSNIDARFYLWEPAPRNNRIIRQDSIFMFGIEPFQVNHHGIKVIKVPAGKKKDILVAMKYLYNISASTIYNDTKGFADSNNKMKPCQKMNDSICNRGYINMIKGNYGSALDFLKLWEGDKETEMSNEEKVELHFSLAVCYKNLSIKEEGVVPYAENAKSEYNKVIHHARHILNNPRLSPRQRLYYKQKCTRAFNGIIDMEYASKNYLEAIDVCNTIIAEINHGILMPVKSKVAFIQSNKNLSPKYCRIAKLEMFDLEIIENWNRYEDSASRAKLVEQMEMFYGEAVGQKGNTFFDKMLIEYYKEMFDVIVSYDVVSISDYRRHFVTWMNEPQKQSENNIYDGFIMWNFTEIREAIHATIHPELCKKKAVLLDITAYVISFRDKFQMQSWGRSDEM